MPFWVIRVLELIIPPIMQMIVNHYSKKEQTPEVAQKLQAHQAALDNLKKV